MVYAFTGSAGGGSLPRRREELTDADFSLVNKAFLTLYKVTQW